MSRQAAVPPDLWAEIDRRIGNAVAAALRSGPSRNTSITGGQGLTIQGGALRVNYPASLGGRAGVYFGDLYAIGTGVYQGTGLNIQDPDGVDIASFRSDVSGYPAVVLRDAAENAILYADNSVGQGLGKPYFSVPFYRARNADWPSTTSATFETLYRAKAIKQHPKLQVRAWGVNTVAGATGEIRVMVNGVQLGSTFGTVSGTVAEGLFYATVADAWSASLQVEIQARLATGTGAVQVCASELTSRN